MLLRHFLLTLLAAAIPAVAQPPSNTYSVAGPAPRSALPAQLRAAPGSVPATRVRLPAPPPVALEKVRKANDAPGPKRIQIGLGRPLNDHPAAKSDRFQWQRIAEGWVGHWEVASEGAASLRVALRLEGLPAAAEVRFTDIAEAIVYGPFAASDVQAQAPYWSPVIEGDTARVEVFLPARHAPGQVRVELDSVSHLYVSPTGRFDPLFGSGHSGACTQDLACATAADPALATAGRSVAGMTFSDKLGTYACTGTLLNPKGVPIPYFYSAAHCFDTQAMANSLTTHWSIDRAGCGSGGTSGSVTASRTTGTGEASASSHAATTCSGESTRMPLKPSSSA